MPKLACRNSGRSTIFWIRSPSLGLDWAGRLAGHNRSVQKNSREVLGGDVLSLLLVIFSSRTTQHTLSRLVQFDKNANDQFDRNGTSRTLFRITMSSSPGASWPRSGTDRPTRSNVLPRPTRWREGT